VKYIPVERQPDATPAKPLLRDDTKFAAGKIAAVQYVAIAVLVFVGSGFWDLQVRNEEFYSEKALQNQIKSWPIPAPRGRVLDRDGRVIVDNHSSFRLILSRESLREEHIRPIALGLNLDPLPGHSPGRARMQSRALPRTAPTRPDGRMT
jgi:penicillin-binding protein 2